MCISKSKTSLFRCPIPKNELNKYTDIKKNFSALSDIAFRLFGSLQNNAMMPSVIKFWQRDRKMREVLFGYDAKKILGHYCNDPQKLFAAFRQVFPVKSAESKPNLWLKFAKRTITGNRYIYRFGDAKAFDFLYSRQTRNEEDTIGLFGKFNYSSTD